MFVGPARGAPAEQGRRILRDRSIWNLTGTQQGTKLNKQENYLKTP